MNEIYMDIKRELQVMRKELQERLAKEVSRTYEMEFGQELGYEIQLDAKKKLLLHDIREDLKDVERALFKMEIDMYGVCEETGEMISLKRMKMLPTARTIYEFLYKKVNV
ncbi:molecular chaperone DnaK [Bacillus cytotoxicus]|uniref:Transcriptional regulator, TraR/DksA family n=2 Tax=Bacillus cytotoxicus TaxID=580165 RepID=A0AAX2CJ11_9BACI|nr:MULTISPECIES: molecular chaperone DnaK [Bacillus cereus group]ABS22777.1 transcriptional regulator, TraR/DksA family [Bacillus cytotoxicus NVH 391-98]AWC29441.1 molecular chaperone DnaK [Bacillus cytotoxicus]AWC33454.1 molecular chaperone DnaK [Bacillus cytotoxicus]AWC37432.1 molecular chaperone DnaK [Bacillus cytotoxicus]AWC41572.1 molecular chaperone DnaK [Bacillus cytotoxicus]